MFGGWVASLLILFLFACFFFPNLRVRVDELILNVGVIEAWLSTQCANDVVKQRSHLDMGTARVFSFWCGISEQEQCVSTCMWI